jgi:type IV secretory pathway VirB4 component
MTGIEMNKIDAEKRAIKAGYNPETIRHSIKDNYAHITETYDDMLNKNQKLFFVNITVCVGGENLEELNENCKIVMSKARKYTCQLNTFTIQQEEAWKMTLPFGYIPKETAVDRSLTTESLAVFIPFSAQELFQPGGFYYGLNPVSSNLVIVNRTDMKTPSGFVLGTAGSGKSLACKREIMSVLLSDDKTNVLIIDPENEYGDFCRAFGGEVIKISPSSTNYINPMDMPLEYGLEENETLENTSIEDAKEKALKKKSDYIISIIEAMITKNRSYSAESEITPQQKTIIDRALRSTYSEYIKSDFAQDKLPNLYDLQKALDEEASMANASADAKKLAEGVEYYTRGSMDIFAHKTNVNLNNRLVVFSVRNLSGQLKQIALTIVFDFIWNKMIENKNRKVRTYCYCDEIHVMFKSFTSSDYLNQLYKRGRKYGLVITGITQNVRDLLKSDQAQGMLGNADFIMMLNQNEDDLDVLTRLLHISETQKTYVTGAKPGDGLLFAENVIVPFTDEFPKDSYLYALITTKFDEEMTNDEVNQIIEELLGRTEAQEIPEAVSEEKRNGRYILNPENEGIESASTNLNTQAG